MGENVVLDLGDEGLVVKHSYFSGAVGIDHFAIAMLDSFHPLSLINTSVLPIHLSITLPLIIDIVALISIASSPLEHPIAMLLIPQVLPLISIAPLRISLI